MNELLSKKCIPCEGGTLPLTKDEIDVLHEQVSRWTVSEDLKKISNEFKFKDFAEAMVFANKIAALAEEEGHHPDLLVAWGKVGVELSTHAIGGLSENDFILAAKIDALV
jgi:4a-hydroxytetrahydrobiopterin dehydratase